MEEHGHEEVWAFGLVSKIGKNLLDSKISHLEIIIGKWSYYNNDKNNDE